MLAALPLMIIPFALYNVALFGLIGFTGDDWLAQEIVSLTMMSGAQWTMSVGNLLIVVSLLLLCVEVIKASRPAKLQLADHLLSLLVFVVFLVEFLLFARAATDVFFILMVIALVDVVAGFAVALRAAQRDVSIGL